MKKLAFITLLLFTVPSSAERLGCTAISMAATGQAAGKIRRFTDHFPSACMFIETLRTRTDEKPIALGKICELEGKSMSWEYADVSFNSGEFHDDKLYFELSITPLELTGEEIKLCEVIFSKDNAVKLECTNDKRMSDIRPSLFSYDTN